MTKIKRVVKYFKNSKWGVILRHKYRTQFTCAMEIDFDLDGDVVSNIEFIGGCNGNLKAISKLVDGFTVEQIEQKLWETPAA